MTYLTSWEEFAKAAERLYLGNPMKIRSRDEGRLIKSTEKVLLLAADQWVCRYVMKYRPSDGMVTVKMTDDQVCLKYRTEHAQDVKKLEKFSSQLMRLMASKDGK